VAGLVDKRLTADSVFASRIHLEGRWIFGRADQCYGCKWAIIGPLLPSERGRWGRPAQDNRRYLEGILWVTRTGSQWRHLPDEYGSVPALSALGGRRRVRRHARNSVGPGATRPTSRHGGQHRHPGAPLRGRHKKGTQNQEALGRSRGGFSTKIHARCDARGRPFGFTLTPGQVHDTQGFPTLLRMIDDRIRKLIGDKGYDSDAIRAELRGAGP